METITIDQDLLARVAEISKEVESREKDQMKEQLDSIFNPPARSSSKRGSSNKPEDDVLSNMAQQSEYATAKKETYDNCSIEEFNEPE